MRRRKCNSARALWGKRDRRGFKIKIKIVHPLKISEEGGKKSSFLLQLELHQHNVALTLNTSS